MPLGIKQCPHCQSLNRWGAFYCRRCGRELELSPTEAKFLLAIRQDLRELYRRYQELGAGKEFIQDLCSPVTIR